MAESAQVRSTLVIADGIRSAVGGDGRTAHGYLDFVVDGESLLARVNAMGFDLVTPLWTSEIAAPSSDRAVARLLGQEPGDAAEGRSSVFVCGECGDLGCGAVTAVVTVSDDTARWSDWGYQNSYETETDRDSLVGLPDLVFDRAAYEAVLIAALSVNRRDRER